MHKSGGSQSSSSQNGSAIGFIKIGTHAGYITHIITYIISNCSRITRVVLWDAGFHFAYQVRAHVGRFRIDAASHAGKQGLRAGTHTEGQHGGGNHAEFGCRGVDVGRDKGIEKEIPERDVEQAEADNDQSHDRTAAESHAQSFVQGVTGSVGSTCRCVGRRFHTQKAGKSGEESSGEECYRYPRVLQVEAVGHDRKQHDECQKDQSHDFVLLFQVRHGTLAHMRGDFLHDRCAFTFFHHLAVEVPSQQQCQ